MHPLGGKSSERGREGEKTFLAKLKRSEKRRLFAAICQIPAELKFGHRKTQRFLKSRSFGFWGGSWMADPEDPAPSPETRRGVCLKRHCGARVKKKC